MDQPTAKKLMTRMGITVRCQLDENLYTAGIKVSDQEMDNLNILRHEFHGEWNYTIKPRRPEIAR